MTKEQEYVICPTTGRKLNPHTLIELDQHVDFSKYKARALLDPIRTEEEKPEANVLNQEFISWEALKGLDFAGLADVQRIWVNNDYIFDKYARNVADFERQSIGKWDITPVKGLPGKEFAKRVKYNMQPFNIDSEETCESLADPEVRKKIIKNIQESLNADIIKAMTGHFKNGVQTNPASKEDFSKDSRKPRYGRDYKIAGSKLTVYKNHPTGIQSDIPDIIDTTVCWDTDENVSTTLTLRKGLVWCKEYDTDKAEHIVLTPHFLDGRRAGNMSLALFKDKCFASPTPGTEEHGRVEIEQWNKGYKVWL